MYVIWNKWSKEYTLVLIIQRNEYMENFFFFLSFSVSGCEQKTRTGRQDTTVQCVIAVWP